MQHIMVRVESPNYDNWLKAFNHAKDSMVDFGITDWRIYRDTAPQNAVLVHFMVNDLAQAMEFFKSPRFQEANKIAGATGREFYIAEKR